MKNKTDYIQHLSLSPHPEGGYYKETYRSDESYPTTRGTRSASTGIYFLLGWDDLSTFHVIKSDEMWHHYDGCTLEIHEITSTGAYKVTYLGKDLSQGEVPQYVVAKGHIFGSKISRKRESNGIAKQNPTSPNYVLVGCTVAPGFDFHDFKLINRDTLINSFPKIRNQIISFFDLSDSI